MRTLLVILTLIVLLAIGCAANSVSLTQWWSRVTLIDSDGNIYEGKAIFHWTYHDGTIEIPNSAYGALSGRFSTQTSAVRSSSTGFVAAPAGSDTIIVPSIGFQSIKLGSNEGTAYLAHEGKVIFRCRIGVDFKTQGMGDAQMVGGGVCVDTDGNAAQILFGR